MKKVLSLFLSIVLLVSTLSLFVGAADNRSGINLEYIKTNNVSHPSGYYVCEKKYDKMPITFEAWVYIPKSVYSQRGGQILGNYQSFSKDEYVNFEVHTNGVPRLVFGDPSGTMHDYKFASAVIPADKWTHLTIVYGTGSQGKQIFCYINGVIKQKTNINDWYEASPATLDNFLCLAGDYRSLNEHGFRGTLGDVAVYSDVRSAEEVLSDSKNKPDLSDENLMMYLDLSNAESFSDITDSSGNGYNMKYYRMWLTEEEMKEIRAEDEYEYTYALAFLPDIQYMTQKYPLSLQPLFNYLVNQGKAKNIQYVLGLGDITNANSPKEWGIISHQTDRLNGYVPYSLVSGNHDVLLNNRLELFNQTYAKKTGYYYQHVAANGGFFDKESVRNTFLTFSVGEIDYLIINLDFGATDDILEWAGSVLDSHPNHRAIITTHGYLNADGSTLDSNDYASPDTYDSTLNSGEAIWQKLVSKHENIDMIVSGHMSHDSIVCTPREGDAGNTVYQLLMDPQTTCKNLGGMGVIGMMYFTEDGNHAKVEYYSTVFDMYFHESNKNILMTFGKSEEEETTAEIETSSPSDTSAQVTAEPQPEPATTPAENKGCGAAFSGYAIAIISLPLLSFIKKKTKK